MNPLYGICSGTNVDLERKVKIREKNEGVALRYNNKSCTLKLVIA